MTATTPTQRLAWAFGLSGALACVLTAAVTARLGLASEPVLLFFGYLFGVLMGLLGALIAAREPRNSIGWLMCATSLATSLINLPSAYAYAALVTERNAWPLGSQTLWFATWSSIPIFGLLLPFILSRFPDGRARPRWWAADWLAVMGTAMFLTSVALAPADLPLFVPERAAAQMAPYAHNPLGAWLPAGPLAYLWMAGLATILAAYVASAGALVSRFRHASPEASIQLKWFAYAGVLSAIAAVYAGVGWDLGQSLNNALIPLELAVVTLPVAIGIAILRHRLFDIDLIINRTLVYLGLTAILGALYAAAITFLNRFFISVTGQKSDAAYVLTAFVVVAAFGPLKDWLQRHVDRRLGGATASKALERFATEVDAVVSVLDVHRVACQLVDQAVTAFDSRGGALYLQSVGANDPLYCRGHLNGESVLEVDLRHDGRQMGKLVLSGRRGDATYSRHDRDALQRSADSVGEALALAAHLGHQSLLNHNSPKEG